MGHPASCILHSPRHAFAPCGHCFSMSPSSRVALLALLADLAAGQRTNRWSSSNMLVLRTGDGTAAYSGTVSRGAPVFLDEVVLSGPVSGSVAQSTLVQNTSAGHFRLTLDQYYWRDGWAQRSGDGRFVSVMGLDLAYGTAWPGTAATTLKTIARIAADGGVDTTSRAVDMFQGSNYYMYSAATWDGTGNW